VLVLLLWACNPTPKDSAAPLTCSERFDGPPPTQAADIEALAATAIGAYAPVLSGVEIRYAEISSESVFFQANLDVTTIEDDPLERSYTLQYNAALFSSPPSSAAVGAILVHELRHILDYAEMESAELSEFLVWYLSEDVSSYERATDEYALEAGCGEGLIAYREWLYATIPPEALAEKQRNYYTPEEIEAWMAANP